MPKGISAKTPKNTLSGNKTSVKIKQFLNCWKMLPVYVTTIDDIAKKCNDEKAITTYNAILNTVKYHFAPFTAIVKSMCEIAIPEAAKSTE